MLSSIFSSKDFSQKSIGLKWGATWILVVFICFATLLSYELFLKHKGFIPSIESNKNLWSWYRSKVNNTPNSLIIIGASRSQLDINVPYLKQKMQHYDITQLSVNGNYPMATLKGLAEDKDFIGTIIVSINAQALESVYLDMQLPQNDYFENKSSFYKSLDAYFTALLQSRFRVLHPLLSLQQIVEYYDINNFFKPVFYTTANLDQSVSADYSLTNSENLYNHFISEKEKNYQDQKPTLSDEWAKSIDLLLSYTQAIESRGGQVIYIRFPTFEGHWQLDEKYYPRQLYWDKIAQQSNLKTIHFNDVNGMDQFESPDSSHLDQSDSVKFTDILFDEILKRKYLN